MALTKAEKEEIFAEYQIKPGDTGSTQVQVAMLTKRILMLTEHLRQHKHDNATRRGLLKLVGQRRRLLGYIRKNDPESYQALIQRLGLRR
jgi:small subunit ribosomal protein S15